MVIGQIYQALRTGRDDVDESRDTTGKSWWISSSYGSKVCVFFCKSSNLEINCEQKEGSLYMGFTIKHPT